MALNFQTDGEEMDIYRGRFLENGNCGFVLKPQFMIAGENKTLCFKVDSFVTTGTYLKLYSV